MEQASDVRINLSTLTSSRDYGGKYGAAGWNVSYDIVPSFGDAAFILADLNYRKCSFNGALALMSNKPNYSFQLRTTVTDGVDTFEHIETVNLSLTESLQASSFITAQEADAISIAIYAIFKY